MDVRIQTLAIMAATLATRVPVSSTDGPAKLPVLTDEAMIACAQQARELLEAVENNEDSHVI